MNETEEDFKEGQEPSDQELIEAFQKGDQTVFEVLVSRYEDRLFNTVLGLVRNQHEAEDVFQDVLLKLYKKLKDFRGESKFFTWLYRVSVNTTWDHLRKKKRRPAISLDAAIEDKKISPKKLESPDAGPSQLAEGSEGKQILNKVLGKLKPDHRIVLQLKEVEGYSYQEIADILKCSIGTVESRLFRARAQLKKKLVPFMKENK